jgi:hypothetical protein
MGASRPFQWPPIKSLSCLAYKLKPLWTTSGACFYCWELLLNHCGPRLGPLQGASRLDFGARTEPSRGPFFSPGNFSSSCCRMEYTRVWATSGTSFYCWELLLNHCGPRLGHLHGASRADFGVSTEPSRGQFFFSGYFSDHIGNHSLQFVFISK